MHLGRHPPDRYHPGRHPPRQTQHPSWADTPQADTPPHTQMATAADGTHPTGMHSCWNLISSKHNMTGIVISSSTRALHFMFLTLCFYLSAILEFTPSPTSPPTTQPPTTLPPTLVPPQCSSWSPQTCRNGGSIVVVNGQCACQCTSGWTGLYCDGKSSFSKKRH